MAPAQTQNAELVRRVGEALARRDLEAAAECVHPDVEVVMGRNLLEGGSYRGRDGFRRAWEDVFDTWDEVSYERVALHEGENCVVSLGISSVRAKGGSPPVEFQQGWVCRFRDEKIVHIRVYLSHREALEAVGLDER